jgi:hypothetical protein
MISEAGETMSYTVDRINRLLDYLGLDWPDDIVDSWHYKADITETLDFIDTAMNVDSATIPSTECQCLWHIGKACHARRQVGARVALLEECMARMEFEKTLSAKPIHWGGNALFPGVATG